MRVFVTGASGHIGSALIPELLGAGHHVLALARSDAPARKLEAADVEVRRGDLDDLDVIGKAAADAATTSRSTEQRRFRKENTQPTLTCKHD